MRFRKHATEQDFELNLASIIDCFTVLITYLLLSASFLSLGMLDVTVASTTPEDSQPVKPPSATVVISVQAGGNLKVDVTTPGGRDNRVTILPPKSVAGPSTVLTLDYESMNAELLRIKGSYSELTSVLVTAENDVHYRELVRTVEETRVTFPQVALGAQ